MLSVVEKHQIYISKADHSIQEAFNMDVLQLERK